MRPAPLERWIGFAATAAAALYVWFTLQPDLIFQNTTTNGGDTGAHVWWPAYLRDHILPSWRLTGWTPDWYAGFPAGHFYFPLPSLLIVLLDVVLPYNVAFKIVTALGPVMLPVGAYVFARGIGARGPVPPLFAVATLPFVFYTGYTIYGGNLASNLAGEFSFTIALVLSLCFLGTLARALDERSGLAVPTAFLAATALSHLIVTVFAIAGALIIWLLRRPLANFKVTAAIGSVGALVTAVWSLPLVVRLGYTTDMGWAREPAMGENRNLLPLDLRWAFVLAIVATVAGIAFARRDVLTVVLLAAVFGVAFVVAPETRLWNARLLPFYYLSVLFLAAYGLAELAGVAGRWLAAAIIRGERLAGAVRSRWRRRFPARPGGPPLEPVGPTTAGDGPGSDTGAAPVPPPDPGDDVPAGAPVAEAGGATPGERAAKVLAGAFPAVVVAVALIVGVAYTYETRSFLPSWIRWNYTGYEAKPAYPEYREVIETMGGLEPGRALWEPSSRINEYGTTLALELLPHFTDGRIGSMEGLYFESSASTPFHFLTVASLAATPSNPVRNLCYRTMADFDLGVRQMQLFGVRWFMANSDQAKAAADDHPDLRFVTETGSPEVEPLVFRWRIYEVLDAPLVEPLTGEPVVLDGIRPGRWLEQAVAWFDDPAALDRPLAADGPAAWARIDPPAPQGEEAGCISRAGSPAAGVPVRDLPEIDVTDIESGEDWVRFRVSEPGVPVLVKTSYFPAWKADGAHGPYRATPNLMVVVPTEREVSLRYGRTPVDHAGTGLSVLGVAGLVLLGRWRPGPLAPRRSGWWRFWRRAAAADGAGAGAGAADAEAAGEAGPHSEEEDSAPLPA